MTTITPPSIGSIITSPTVRKAIYSAYGVIAFVVAGIQVGYSSASLGAPTWLTVALAIVAFAAVPIGTLAVANANNTTAAPNTITIVNPSTTGTIGVDTGIPSAPSVVE